MALGSMRPGTAGNVTGTLFGAIPAAALPIAPFFSAAVASARGSEPPIGPLGSILPAGTPPRASPSTSLSGTEFRAATFGGRPIPA
jgi:hypothetical protein